jgi:hypothetical protein
MPDYYGEKATRNNRGRKGKGKQRRGTLREVGTKYRKHVVIKCGKN